MEVGFEFTKFLLKHVVFQLMRKSCQWGDSLGLLDDGLVDLAKVVDLVEVVGRGHRCWLVSTALDNLSRIP